jgi:hypothetical protein
MPQTITNNTGDGVIADQIASNIQMPDTGSSVLVGGQVHKVGNPAVAITGSPLTFPAAPGSGIINVIVQVNWTTGAASIKQNTTPGVFPTVDAGNIQIFQTVLQTTTSNLALCASNVTPDSW